MDEIQKVLVNAGRKDLAQKYYKKIAGRWAPDITSTKRTTIIFDRKDFKSSSFFEGLFDELGLNDAFQKKIEGFDSGGEPEPDIKTYDRITLFINKSEMEA